MLKLPAAQALTHIRKILCNKLAFVPLDLISRTKAQIFAAKDEDGKQFAIILGSLDPSTKTHEALSTIIVLENCTPPVFKGITPTNKQHRSAALHRSHSKLKIPNQSTFEVGDETALEALLTWYTRS